MAELSLTALQDTVIKRFTIDSTDIDNPGEKFDLEKGEKIGINWYRPASKNHWEFELKSPHGGFFNWYVFQPHVQINDPTPSHTEASGSKQVMAFLDAIAWPEGTDKSVGDGVRTGYNIMFTGKTFSSFADHPRRVICSGSLCSDAAGRYQFLSKTWDGVAKKLGLKDFSPSNQDKAAIQLIKQRGALDEIEKGKIRAACDILSWEWASLPPGRYGQPTVTYEKMEQLFKQAGGVLG